MEHGDVADSIAKVVRMWDARANLKSVQAKNGRRGASQQACDEVNQAGFAWQAAWDAITEDDIDALRAELAAATAGPVALTEEDEIALADAILIGMQTNSLRPQFDALDDVLDKLNDLGYAIVRRTA